jgi:hypothetical protein
VCQGSVPADTECHFGARNSRRLAPLDSARLHVRAIGSTAAFRRTAILRTMLVDREASVVPDRERWHLVTERQAGIRTFLKWAAAYERDPRTSRRFENRRDLKRVQEVLHLFREPWWGVVVYSCFDSVTGTRAAAVDFRRPRPEGEAMLLASRLQLPEGSVRFHRKQQGHTGARRALVAACQYQELFRSVLLGPGDFEARFSRLMELKADRWGRTTCFDVLARAGLLGIGGESYRPSLAHLAGSTGPSAGFARVWGVEVRRGSAPACEALLRWWTGHWDTVSSQVGVPWPWPPLDSADLENYLCIFHETDGVVGGPSTCPGDRGHGCAG